MEHAIGTRITLEVVEVESRPRTCRGCFFKEPGKDCAAYGVKCLDAERTDHKNVIYKIKETDHE